MIFLLLVLTVVIAGLAASAYLLGFQLGRDGWQQEVLRSRLEAAHAERQLHDLTREALAAMVAETNRHSRRS